MATNDDADGSEFEGVWTRFVNAARRLLSGAPSERILDPYLPLRDSALAFAESLKLKAELVAAWLGLHRLENGTVPEVAHIANDGAWRFAGSCRNMGE